MRLSPDVFLPCAPGKRNPLIPRDGLMLCGAGQCLESALALSMRQGDGRKPALIALYERVDPEGYFPNPDILQAHALFPGVVLQIGLALPLFNKAALTALADGRGDRALMDMAENYRRIGEPILLRVGYEFDGVAWNGYDPEAYKGAFKRVARALQAQGARNVALVWDSYTIDTPNVMDWFPGEDVVDWLGYNTLAPRFWEENKMASLAREMGRPLMNGEASYAIGVEAMPFSRWVEGYFSSMRRDKVAAYQYINWRWSAYPKAANWNGWANGRITDDPALSAQYLSAMGGEGMVFRDEAYSQPVCLLADAARAMGEDEPEGPWDVSLDHVSALPGYRIHVEGAATRYGGGWNPSWACEDACRLHFDLPEAFSGDCILRLDHSEAITLSVNGEPVTWLPGRGYLHIPVAGEGRMTLAIQREGDGPLYLSHAGLIRSGSLPAPKARREGDLLRWQMVPGASRYRVYCDGLLTGITDQTEYPVSGRHTWRVAAYDSLKGVSAQGEKAE